MTVHEQMAQKLNLISIIWTKFSSNGVLVIIIMYNWNSLRFLSVSVCIHVCVWVFIT